MNHHEIADNIFRIEIPLPETPLKVVNSYLVRGPERNLLIDTGFNHEQCRRAMEQALLDLHVDMERTDLFITHMHADHCGLIRAIAAPGTRIFMSHADGAAAADSQSDVFWGRLLDFYVFTGLTDYGFTNDVTIHPGYSWAPTPGARITEITDGQVMEVGDYRFHCIATPGHTDGHMCLYAPEQGMLFSGDHILGRITPNITLSSPDRDVLAQYLASLDKIAALSVQTVFPGHRQRIDNCGQRIEELKAHHQHRLDEVAVILSGRTLSTVEVTSEMRWSLTYRSWYDYPLAQKMFSTGEAFAHLYHLVALGKASMAMENGVYRFSLCEGGF